jgi:drug/metabolite transporter (DMT)-like permease
MTLLQMLPLVGYSVGMVFGQMLFKLAAASQLAVAGESLTRRAFALAFDKYFIAAMAMYLLLSLSWVRILQIVPISRAYPFVALSFILVAGAGVVFFSERLSPLNWGGLLMIGAGIVLATRGG